MSKSDQCLSILMKRDGWNEKVLHMVPLTNFEKQQLIEARFTVNDACL